MELFDDMLARQGQQRLHRARVMLTHSQDSWVSLPSQLAGQLLTTDVALPLILRVRHLSAVGAPTGRPLHLAWAGGVAAAAGVLEVPSALGRAVGLLSGAQVVLEPLPEGAVAAAEVVVVEPVGPSDWEVVELNAGLLEDRLLSQVAVVALGQPMVVWAGQAVVKLRCTALQPQGLTLARLTAGVELAIAPKPRLGGAAAAAGGSSSITTSSNLLAPASSSSAGSSSTGPPTAAAAAGGPGFSTSSSRYRQLNGSSTVPAQPTVKLEGLTTCSTWLRVLNSRAQHLVPLQTPGPSSNGAGVTGVTSVTSWVTTAVWVSSTTAQDQGLRYGQPVKLQANRRGTTGSSSSSGSMVKELLVNLLTHEAVPWGHVVLTPPLQLVLGVQEHEYIQLLQPQLSPAGAAGTLQQQHMVLRVCPALVARPLLLEGSAGAGSTSTSAAGAGGSGGGPTASSSSSSMGSSSMAVVLQTAAGKGTSPVAPQAAGAVQGSGSMGTSGTNNSSSSASGPPAADKQQTRGYVSSELEPVNSGDLAGDMGGPGSSSAVKGKGACDEVNVWTVLQGLLPRSNTGSGAGTISSSSSSRATGWNQVAAAAGGAPGMVDAGAAHSSSSGSSRGDPTSSWDAQLQQLPAGTSEAAVVAWLRMQLAAAAVAAAGGGCAAAGAGSSSVSAAANGGSGGVTSGSAGRLWLSPTMVVHLRAGDAGMASSSSSSSSGSGRDDREGGVNAGASTAAAAGGGLTEFDHLLLLLPQLPPKPPAAVAAVLQQLPGQPSAAAAGLHWQLPAASLPALGQSKSTPGQQLTVEWAKPLQVSGSAPGRPPLGSPHVQRIPADVTATLGPTHSNQQSNLQLSDLPWLQPAVAACQQWLTPKLDLRTWSTWQSAGLPLGGGVLLSGGGGTGKSAVCQLVGTAAAAAGGDGGSRSSSSGGAEVLLVSCSSLAGSNFTAAAGLVAGAVRRLLDTTPGLLLLDDLDLLCPAPGEGPEAGGHQDGEVAVRLAEWLADLMRWTATQPRPISFLATCKAAAALSPVLRTAGCFDQEVKLPAAGAAGRSSMLATGVRARGWRCEAEVLQELAGATEGYDARDLELLLDRAGHAALVRQLAASSTVAGTTAAGTTAAGSTPAAAEQPPLGGAAAPAAADAAAAVASSLPGSSAAEEQGWKSTCALTKVDFDQALEGYTPGAFRAVGGHAGATKGRRGAAAAAGGVEGWGDVGGMAAAKAALQEALVLPLKFGHLLAAAPLRLRTGLLLYGPPGCGKTHIVAAAVAATGARLVSVKGPELLNKYIGQSEASVREVFGRAAAAAPCVLFFDEFDAIAPPRGHDSTGVTDRVVNQLLTELDGVEGLKGVTVLAATSRPDLIDAALLRPGRLDRQVYCGLPSQQERYDVLAAAASKLPLAPDVDLAALARLTEHYTCADLTALLSEAQLMAVHDVLDAHLPASQRLGLTDQQQKEQPDDAAVEEPATPPAVAASSSGAAAASAASTSFQDVPNETRSSSSGAGSSTSSSRQDIGTPSGVPHASSSSNSSGPAIPPPVKLTWPSSSICNSGPARASSSGGGGAGSSNGFAANSSGSGAGSSSSGGVAASSSGGGAGSSSGGGAAAGSSHASKGVAAADHAQPQADAVGAVPTAAADAADGVGKGPAGEEDEQDADSSSHASSPSKSPSSSSGGGVAGGRRGGKKRRPGRGSGKAGASVTDTTTAAAATSSSSAGSAGVGKGGDTPSSSLSLSLPVPTASPVAAADGLRQGADCSNHDGTGGERQEEQEAGGEDSRRAEPGGMENGSSQGMVAVASPPSAAVTAAEPPAAGTAAAATSAASGGVAAPVVPAGTQPVAPASDSAVAGTRAAPTAAAAAAAPAPGAPSATSGGVPPAPGVPLITAAHLRRALARSRPSLPPLEAARLEAIYSRFRDSRGGAPAAGAAAGEAHKRATLA